MTVRFNVPSCPSRPPPGGVETLWTNGSRLLRSLLVVFPSRGLDNRLGVVAAASASCVVDSPPRLRAAVAGGRLASMNNAAARRLDCPIGPDANRAARRSASVVSPDRIEPRAGLMQLRDVGDGILFGFLERLTQGSHHRTVDEPSENGNCHAPSHRKV